MLGPPGIRSHHIVWRNCFLSPVCASPSAVSPQAPPAGTGNYYIVQQRVEEIEGMGWRANHGQVDQALDVSIVVQLLPLDTIHHICKGSDLALCRV